MPAEIADLPIQQERSQSNKSEESGSAQDLPLSLNKLCPPGSGNILDCISKLDPKARAEADNALLDDIEKAHFNYFVDQSDANTGLTKDRSTKDSASSIAAVGFSLTSYPIAVERGWIDRDKAADYTLKVMRTLWNTPQGEAEAGTSGYKGFFYHFLDPKDGTRTWKSELSSIDTALLMAGVLFSKNYFSGQTDKEQEIREFADKLYRRVDWNWMLNKDRRVSMGWFPESGFISYDWQGYNEAMILLILGLGSPTHALPKDTWDKYTSTEQLINYGGQTYIDFRPHFGHQYSHAWVDFRGITDAKTKALKFDYFENSRRATYGQNYYAIQNPLGFKGYSKLDWGLTASDGPGDAYNKSQANSLIPLQPQPGSHEAKAEKLEQEKTATGTLLGREKINNFYQSALANKNSPHFFSYIARGAPNSIDDGTIAPTAAAASLPFAPELVMPTLYHWRYNRPEIWSNNGFKDAFNPTAEPSKPSGWVDHDTLGIDQGPIVLMTENYRTGMVWELMKKDKYLVDGLKKAGFTGGWLK